MSKKKKSDATAQPQPIKFETIYPIGIRTKDGALSFDEPGQPIKFETNESINVALLAHKMNEIIIQLHRLQRVAFVNNQIIAEQLRIKSSGNEEKTDDKAE